MSESSSEPTDFLLLYQELRGLVRHRAQPRAPGEATHGLSTIE